MYTKSMKWMWRRSFQSPNRGTTTDEKEDDITVTATTMITGDRILGVVTTGTKVAEKAVITDAGGTHGAMKQADLSGPNGYLMVTASPTLGYKFISFSGKRRSAIPQEAKASIPGSQRKLIIVFRQEPLRP